jgi:hypothetical protein
MKSNKFPDKGINIGNGTGVEYISFTLMDATMGLRTTWNFTQPRTFLWDNLN